MGTTLRNATALADFLFSCVVTKLDLLSHESIAPILSLRDQSHPAGHWVVMQATISGVDLYVMAYAWSLKVVFYSVCIYEKVVMHSQPYISCFEDEYENIQENMLPRPTVAHVLVKFRQLI